MRFELKNSRMKKNRRRKKKKMKEGWFIGMVILLLSFLFLSKTFTHSLYANASGGESVILDTWSVLPASYGSHLSTGTAIGYDSLGTEGQLTAREGTVVGIYSRDIGCLDASVGSQVALTQGIAHSSTRAEKGIDYDFSAQGKGSVEVGCNAVPISTNSHGTYSQHLKLDACCKSTRGDGMGKKAR